MSQPVNINAVVHGAPASVWERYTDPAHITQWNFANPSWHCPSASNDLRPGGQYLARMEAKDGSFGFDFGAVYDEVRPGEGFTYTIGDGRKVTVTFEGTGADTLVTVVFEPEQVNSQELQRAGWQAILNNFKQYCES